MPPIRPIAAADAVNLFNWRNLLDHPIPALVVASMLVVWATAAIALACVERGQDASFGKSYLRDDLEGEENGSGDMAVHVSKRGGGGCCDRDSFNFYLSTQSLRIVLKQHIDRLPDEQTADQKRACCAFAFDSRTWAAARANWPMTVLRSHPLLSIWYHNRLDPYSTQLRLCALFASLLISMAVNASMFVGDARLSGADPAANGNPISSVTLAFYSSFLMLLVSMSFSGLFIRAGTDADARGTNWWMWAALAVLFVSCAAAAVTCLMYAMRFDLVAADANQGSSLGGASTSARWLQSIGLAFLQKILFNSPLFITLRLVWAACFARSELGGAGSDFGAPRKDGDTSAIRIEMTASVTTFAAAAAGTGEGDDHSASSSLSRAPSFSVVRRASDALASDRTAHLRRAAAQIAWLLKGEASNRARVAREVPQIMRDMEQRGELALFLGVCVELDVQRAVESALETANASGSLSLVGPSVPSSASAEQIAAAAAQALRSSSVSSRVLSLAFAQRGSAWLRAVATREVGLILRSTLAGADADSLEIDPARLSQLLSVDELRRTLEANRRNVETRVEAIMRAMRTALPQLDAVLVAALAQMHGATEAAFPGAQLGALVVGDCLVRRFLCAALVLPLKHGIALDAAATQAHAAFAGASVRPAVLVAKVLQLVCCSASSSVSASALAAKDELMAPMAAFIERQQGEFRALVATLLESSTVGGHISAPPSLVDALPLSSRSLVDASLLSSSPLFSSSAAALPPTVLAVRPLDETNDWRSDEAALAFDGGAEMQSAPANPLGDDAVSSDQRAVLHAPTGANQLEATPAAASSEWTQYNTDDGVPYYVSAVTGQSRWDCPS
jgi:hypothetical protein